MVWLTKPFSDSSHLTPQQQCFNYRLSRAQIVVENAFGCLKPDEGVFWIHKVLETAHELGAVYMVVVLDWLRGYVQ